MLCRIAFYAARSEKVPLTNRRAARHKKSDIFGLEITPKILSAVPFKMTVAKVRLAMAATRQQRLKGFRKFSLDLVWPHRMRKAGQKRHPSNCSAPSPKSPRDLGDGALCHNNRMLTRHSPGQPLLSLPECRSSCFDIEVQPRMFLRVCLSAR
jgi:hypothetical protein